MKKIFKYVSDVSKFGGVAKLGMLELGSGAVHLTEEPEVGVGDINLG